MTRVAPPISSRVTTRIHLRPSRSPKWEKKIPPSGRNRNPTANVLKLASRAAAGEMLGKNSWLKTSAEAVP